MGSACTAAATGAAIVAAAGTAEGTKLGTERENVRRPGTRLWRRWGGIWSLLQTTRPMMIRGALDLVTMEPRVGRREDVCIFNDVRGFRVEIVQGAEYKRWK